jgi:hypothetical protein
MYCGVPTTSPVPVMRGSAAASAARAMPKSATIASPSYSRMFSGLMSRCTTSRACAYSSADATWRV